MKAIFLLLNGIAWLCAPGQPGSEPAFYARVASFDSSRTGNFFINPARLASEKNVSGSLYAGQRFLLPALSCYQMAVVVPAGPGSFGISGGRFGNSDFNVTSLGLAYARGLGDRVDLGVRFFGTRQRPTGYQHAHRILFELGTLVRITGRLQVGLHAVQPLPAADSNGATATMRSYCLCFGYRPSGAVVVLAEMIRTEGLPPVVHAAVRYQFERRLQATIGIDTGTAGCYMGAGMGLAWITVEAVSFLHPFLGLSPALIIRFQRR